MSNIKNFKRFEGGGNVPIIGQTPPAQIRDALGRILQAGDFIILQTPNEQPFRVQAISPVPQDRLPPGAPPQMQITLSSTTHFLSYRDVANQEFMRIMTREEVDARKEQGETGVSAERPDAKPVAEPVVDEAQTLGDA